MAGEEAIGIKLCQPFATMPTRKSEGAAGLDLAACDDHTLGPGESQLIPTGVAVEFPMGFAGFLFLENSDPLFFVFGAHRDVFG